MQQDLNKLHNAYNLIFYKKLSRIFTHGKFVFYNQILLLIKDVTAKQHC